MFIKMALENFNHLFTLLIIFPLILFAGLYFTFKFRCIQITHLKKSVSLLLQKNRSEEGNISRFGAISAVLAGNFGTGNISGMAVAITTGGPGALVWMWVMAFFGAVIQYTSCVLGVSFRRKNERGEFVGGPMYYLYDGLGLKKTATCFALCTLFGAITVGNFAQVNSIILPFHAMGWNPLYCSLLMAGFVAIVILGGIQRLAAFASLIVPFKAMLYLGTAFIILALNCEKIIPAFTLMLQEAFDFSSVAGGTLGFGAFKAITTGFDRGLFATDAGTGIVPILQAGARSKDPHQDGVSTLITPLLVMIVCTTTGLLLIITGAFQESHLKSTNMVIHAFSSGLGSPIGGYIVIIALILFAYTTILAWSYCGEKALEFLIGSKKSRWFRALFILLIPVGAMIHIDLIWILADIAITLMLLINLIGILKLSPNRVQAGEKEIICFKQKQTV